MMQGHNRPPFAPTIPGTNLRSHDVPTAIIYRPARGRHVRATIPTLGSGVRTVTPAEP
ncbi:Uncharacterised protein [Acinetobacter lwoffii]|nr:Uncharacterised protein [Acinetobacter lwoffii]